jgi:eukaryotic-like serine/threonine-protein kinase
MTQRRLPSFSVADNSFAADAATPALLEYRDQWDRGEAPDAVEFIAARTDLADARAEAIDIIYEEYCRRLDAGEDVDIDVFCDRFPQWRGTLRQLLAVHHYLESNVNLAPAPPKSAWPRAGQRFTGFEVLGEIGRGGFARVYLALDPELANRQVALKVTPEGPAEALTLARLEHPNIVPVYQVREDKATGLTGICMPYHGAVTLASALADLHGGWQRPTRGRELLTAGRARDESREEASASLRPDAALTHGTFETAVAHLGADVADALACAHARGICHRDLKPSNILIDAAGRPLLLDFNLSSDPLAQRRRVGGTLHYMSPEQLRGIRAEWSRMDSAPSPPIKIDPRSDLYSLGVVLYESLTGQLPFAGELSAAEGVNDVILDAIDRAQRAAPRPIRALNPRVDAGLARIVERCLEYDAAARPETATELAAELRRSGNSPWARAVRWSQSHRKVVAACLLAVLTSAIAAGTWAAQREPYPARQVRLGWAAFHRGEHDRAAESFGRALDFDRESVEALVGRARARIANGDHLRALDDLVAAQELRTDSQIEALLGYCKNQMEIPSAAIPRYERAMELGLNTAELLNDLGYSHQKTGNLRDARNSFDRALEINPDLAAARYNRALLGQQRAVSDNQPIEQQAIDDILRAIELAPKAAELHVDAARILTLAGDAPSRTDGIAKHLEQAIELGHHPASFSRDPFLNRWNGEAWFKALCRQTRAGKGGIPVSRVVDPLAVVKR